MEKKHRLPQFWVHLACLCIILGVLGNTKAEDEGEAEGEEQVQEAKPAACGNGWTYIEDQNTCIWFSKINDHKNWQKARDTCKQFGGDLIRIEKDVLYHSVVAIWEKEEKDEFWIGLNDIEKEDNFVWLDDKDYAEFNTSFWQGGEHTSMKWNEDCIEIGIDGTSSYFDANCDEEKRYICQAPVGQAKNITVQVCGENWIPLNENYGGTCVWFSYPFLKETWEDARMECQRRGGDLLTMRSRSFKDLIHSQWSQFSPAKFWIGLNDIAEEGVYSWLDETTEAVLFKRTWDDGQPVNSTEENCLVIGQSISGNGKCRWSVKNCSSKRRFVCQSTAGKDIPAESFYLPFQKMLEQLPCDGCEEVPDDKEDL